MALLTLLHLSVRPVAFAQSLDDGRAPVIAISPDGTSYVIPASSRQEVLDSGGAVTVEVSLKFNDLDGLDRNTMGVTLASPSSTQQIVNVSWTANAEGTFATAKCTIQLIDAGDHVLTARIADKLGVAGSRQATYKVTYSDPSVPIVHLEPHHDDYRDTTLGAATLSYATPAYTSLGASRSAVGLRYDSEQADPTGYVQLDVDLANAYRQHYAGGGLTLTIVDRATNQPVTREEAFGIHPGGRQRIAVQWSMRDRPTGAYLYWADVRAYRSDFTTSSLKRVPVRVLVVNHVASRYGSGWSLAGVPRIHSLSPTTDAGLLLEEGNGVARWFAKESCGYSQCTYRTPQGDFSQVVYNPATSQWTRTHPNGTVVTFTGRGLLKTVSDRFGRAVHYDWMDSADAQKQPLLTQITDTSIPVAKATSLAYHWGTHLGMITDPAGRKTELWYEGATSSGPPAGTGANLSYIGNGAASLWATYDANHRLTSFRDAAGTRDLTYDVFGKLRSIAEPAVTVGGASTARPVKEFSSLQALTVPYPLSSQISCCRKFVVPWDEVYSSVTDAGGHKTRVMTDRYGNPTKIIDDSSGLTVLSGRYSVHGLPESVSSPRQTVIQSWNARGQLLSKEVNARLVYQAAYVSGDQPDYVNAGGSESWYRYGARGELLKSWFGKQTDETRNATTYTYDAAYRLVSVAGPKGEKTEWSYDSVWQNVAEVRRLAEDGSWRKTAFTYDTAGRQASVTSPLGETATTVYDTLNRPLRITQSGRVTELGYTGLQRTSVTVPGGKVYGFQYNALGWLERETFPDGKSRSYTYTIDGLVASRTDRRLRTVTMTYDGSHRMVGRGADGVQTSFSYPSPYGSVLGAVMKNNEVEESIWHHSESGEPYRTSYAVGDNVYAFAQVLDGNAGWISIGVDFERFLFGSLIRTESVRYQDNYSPAEAALSRTFQLHDADGKTTTLAYDASGRHVRTTFPNGVVQENFFNREGQRTATAFNAVPSLGAGYTYDALGRLTARTSAGGDYRRLYQYDQYGQVNFYQKAQLEPAPGCNPSYENCDSLWVPRLEEQYTYDLAGNRTDRNATLEPNSNRYRTFNGYTLEYDEEGNLTRKYKTGFDQHLVWNALGQLASATTNGNAVAYGYTPSGARFRRTEGGQNRYYLYDGGDLVLELDHSGNTLRRYTHLPGIDDPLSVKETIGGTERVVYFTSEHPGHVSALLNAGGGIAAGYEYAPFGTESGTNDGQPLRFMGRELDYTTGLYYVRNRWYDPALARFVSEDPIGLAGGLNTYAYVENDPVNRRDPSGLSDDLKQYLRDVKTRMTRKLPVMRIFIDQSADSGDEIPYVSPSLLLRFGGGGFQFSRVPCGPALCPGRIQPAYPGSTIGPPSGYTDRWKRQADCQFFTTLHRRWFVYELLGTSLTATRGGGNPQLDQGGANELAGGYSDHTRDMMKTACQGL